MTDDGSTRDDTDDRSEAFGPIDASALREIRGLFVDREPLAETASLDDPLNPRTLSIELADGIGEASTARFDVRWSQSSNYAFHYTDALDRNFRFDCHPKPDAPTRHFHPPPDAASRPVEPSCIGVSELSLVTRAVVQLWRNAYECESLEGVNDAENPP
ncbi:hypothetical protein HZS55_05615 [Halosimplex rubrum]|uniref:Uncharacterized protein n=1 Tax=Halosimplex rubrum TaxID=869889 RepID=A0A7D5T5E7_9EURY|nr:hypothetical protein [Halosimplex rubrum]QLH76815.1 hypothetical protein HZS55_05615 [Halosimplex rubrum]